MRTHIVARSRQGWLAALAWGWAGLLIAATAVTWGRAHERGGATVAQAADKSLGVNVDLSALSPAERDAALQRMQAAGFRWVRQRFPWDMLEPSPGAYDWAIWDLLVADCARHNLDVLAVLDGSPEWARAAEDGANRLAPPAEARDLGAFAAAVASRYRGRIVAYQIWDEPNIAPHWGARWVDPAAYARLLRAAALEIRNVDPGARLLLAGLAPNTEPGGANMSDLAYLEQLYAEGGAEWFDVVAAQPFGFGEVPEATPEAGRLNFRRAELLRQVMEAAGDGETPVWAVAFGWPASAGASGSLPADVARAVALARQEWPWLGPMLWPGWSPLGSRPEYALVATDGQPLPLLDTLSTLAGRRDLAYPGAYRPDHPSGSYQGRWRITAQGADIGQSDDRLAIRFWGSRLDLLVRRGAYRAFLYVTVDGEPAPALPQDAQGRAYLVLYDPLLKVEAVTLARGLPPGEHMAELVAEGGWGQWAVAGWLVFGTRPALPAWLPALLALGAAACLVGGVTLAWPWRERAVGLASALFARYRALPEVAALGLAAAAALLLYVVVGTWPTLLSLGLLALLLILRPQAGLPLIAVTLPFYQLGRPVLGGVFSMAEILTLLTGTGWLVGKAASWVRERGSGECGWCARRLRWPRWSGLDWGVVALVVLGGLSILWSDHRHEALREFRTVILESALFYGLLRSMVKSEAERWRVLDAWLLGASAIALVGVSQWALGSNLVTADGVWRVRGFYGSPNNLALYLGRLLPLGTAVAVWHRAGPRRLCYGLGALAMLAAVILTYSRGAWLLGVPASLIFLAAAQRRRAVLAALATLLVAAIVLGLVLGAGRFGSLLDPSQGTGFLRLQLWQSSWTMIREHPVLGVGLDNFLYAYRTRYVLPGAWEEFDLSHPHNLLLDSWLRLGLLGVFFVIGLLWAFFRQALRGLKDAFADRARLLAIGLAAGMVDVVAHGLVDHSLFLVDLSFSFMLMLALVQTREQGEHSDACAS